MRLRIVIPVLACAALLLLALFWTRFHAPGADPAAAPASASEAVAPVAPVARVETGPTPVRPNEEPLAAPASADQENQAWVAQAKLIELSSHDDPESLRTILGGLTSPDPAIRKTALEAARQFGSRDAIPYLQEAVEHTDVPREKVAILDAIDFLKKKSLTELRETAQNSAGAPN